MLAIVIPYYKFNFFESTLQSIKNQTDKRFKVYIGNDASLQDPKDLIDSCLVDVDVHYRAFENNLGGESLPKQWERCLSLLGDEKWIQILGDDDVLSPNCVASFYEKIATIEGANCTVVRFATRVIDKYGEYSSDIYKHPEIETSIAFFLRKLQGGTRSSLSEYIFRRKEMKQFGFPNFPLAWHSDDAAILQFSNFSNIYTINNALVFFRNSGINITSQKDNLALKASASFQYYHFLLSKSYGKFSVEERAFFYQSWEKAFLNIKSKPLFWVQFTWSYLKRIRIGPYFKFLEKAYQSYKKK